MEHHPCYKVFSEINNLNRRLEVLGKEGLKVLKKMKEEGISDEILEPLMNEAKKAAGIQSEEK